MAGALTGSAFDKGATVTGEGEEEPGREAVPEGGAMFVGGGGFADGVTTTDTFDSEGS